MTCLTPAGRMPQMLCAELSALLFSKKHSETADNKIILNVTSKFMCHLNKLPVSNEITIYRLVKFK